MKYIHTNIIANDWKKLSGFYQKTFYCQPILPERNLVGDWIDKLTNIEDVHVRGIHLQLPGYENDGPTLEIFQYNKQPEKIEQKINRPGFAHIAFRVGNVKGYLNKIIENGGSRYGDLVKKKIEGMGTIEVVYACD